MYWVRNKVSCELHPLSYPKHRGMRKLDQKPAACDAVIHLNLFFVFSPFSSWHRAIWVKAMGSFVASTSDYSSPKWSFTSKWVRRVQFFFSVILLTAVRKQNKPFVKSVVVFEQLMHVSFYVMVCTLPSKTRGTTPHIPLHYTRTLVSRATFRCQTDSSKRREKMTSITCEFCFVCCTCDHALYINNLYLYK